MNSCNQEQLNKGRWPAHVVLCYLGVLVFLIFVYSPSITIPFAQNDTWQAGGGPLTETWVNWQHRQCRPICAEINQFWLPLVSDLVSISYVRVFDVMLLAVLVLLTADRIGREISIEPLSAILLCTSIFLLPSIQWAIIMAEPGPLVAVFFALLSSYFARAAAKGLAQPSRTLFVLRPLASTALAMVLLYMSLFTYPAYTFFFLIPPWIAIMFNPAGAWPQVRKEFVAYLIMLLSACVTYFWTCSRLNPPSTVPLPAYRFELSRDIMAHVGHFVYGQAEAVLNLWNIYPSHVVSAIVILLIGAGMGIGMWKKRNAPFDGPNRRTHTLQRFLALIIVPVIMNAPFMVGSGFYPRRVYFCVTVLVVVLLYWAISQLAMELSTSIRQKVVVSALCVQTVIGGLLANYNVSATALSASMEFLFVRMVLFEHKDETIRHIHIIPPEGDGRGYAGFPTVDLDFNSPCLEKPYSAIPLVSHAVKGMGMALRPGRITFGRSNPPSSGTAGVLVINANELKEIFRRAQIFPFNARP